MTKEELQELTEVIARSKSNTKRLNNLDLMIEFWLLRLNLQKDGKVFIYFNEISKKD